LSATGVASSGSFGAMFGLLASLATSFAAPAVPQAPQTFGQWRERRIEAGPFSGGEYPLPPDVIAPPRK
jgi:hypothetical protein